MRTNQTANRLLLCLTLALAAGLCSQHTIGYGQEEKEETPPPVRPVTLEQSEAETRILAALKETTSLEFIDTPLIDVTIYLSDRHNIHVVIDKGNLESEGHGTDTPVTANLKNIRLRSALNLMLAQLELDYVIRDEVLLITTEWEAESELTTHAYAVRDLMQHPDSKVLAPDSLSELVMTQVAPTSWDQVGGPGSMAHLGGTLVVSQTQQVQREVQALLTQLRRAKHALEHDPQQAFSRHWNTAELDQTKGTEKIKAALDKPGTVQFVETPMQDIVLSLSKQMQIPIVLDTQTLDGVGIGPDTPLSANLKNLTLRSALNRMLDEFQLTYVVRDEVLLITSKENAESELNTSVFVVRDLLESPETAAGDSDQLIELITTSIGPHTWDEVGGPGSIAYFELCDALVISQTDQILEQIEPLLGKLRKIRHADKPWSAEQWAQQREHYLKTPRLESFTVAEDPNRRPVIEMETIINFLNRSLDDQIREKGQITVKQRTITMHLTPAELAKVEALLKRSGLPVYNSAEGPIRQGGGFGGGFGGGGGSGEAGGAASGGGGFF